MNTFAPAGLAYSPGEPAVIRFGTDVWITDSSGQPVVLSAAITSANPMPVDERSRGCDCETDFFAGTHAPTDNTTGDDAEGVERCDSCQVFASDFEAAAAVVAHIGGDLIVRYLPDETDPRYDAAS